MGKTEQQARQEILAAVADYYRAFRADKPPFTPGSRIPYAGRVFDEKDMVSLVDAALEFWLTGGRYTEKFEQGLSEYLKIPYCLFVNSGSSANLLAFMSLTSPLLKERQIKPGDEIITVAAGFPTTVAPIIQYGAVPVFVDVTIPEYNIDVSRLEKARSSKTKAVMLAHTLGNPFDLLTVSDFCKKYGYWLIEDNCDALGSACTLQGEERLTGTVGDIGTSSFYPPHHMTTGEGGAVYTRDPLLWKIALSMRDWGRDCTCRPGQDNMCGQRFNHQYGQLPSGYDHKYVYSHFGYNLKATDLQAAIGVEQLKKLPGFVRQRRHNFQRLYEGLRPFEDRLILPAWKKDTNPSWFGFAITCREGVCRNRLVQALETNGIQTRMLFAGNLICHPCFDSLRETGTGYRVAGSLENTGRIMNDTFWVGVYPGMSDDMLDYMVHTIQREI